MGRFRRWLIHKLGGLCKDDVVKKTATIFTREKEIQRIKVEFTTTFEDMPKEEIRRILLDGIYRELSTYYFEIKKLELNKCNVYSMELEFVLQ